MDVVVVVVVIHDELATALHVVDKQVEENSPHFTKHEDEQLLLTQLREHLDCALMKKQQKDLWKNSF